MWVLKWLSVLLISKAFLAQDFGGADEDAEETGRDLRDFNQDWRAIDYFSPSDETSAWIPHTDNEPPKRRRIKKRKRRPPVISITDEETMEEELLTMEEAQKPTTRRRIPPTYEDAKNFERIRDPFTALQEAEEKQRKKTPEEETTKPDLKTLLKQQSGALSLSELLQKRNLSLAQLLMGNQQAISILTTQEPEKYKRLPPSIGMKKEIDRNYEKSTESLEGLTSEEVQEAQRKRLALLHKETKLFNDVTTKFEVVTEETTKRVFVPSTTKALPITISAKGRPQLSSAPLSSDGPLKMSFDLEEITELPSTTTLPSVTTRQSPKLAISTAKDELMEILKNPTDREDLSRILRVRNMSVEQLVEQRERGSSQLHLADIFHNNTREPEPKEEPFIGEIHHHQDNFFGTFPIFNNHVRKAKNRVVPTVVAPSPTPQYITVTSFPTFKIEVKTPVPQVPVVWKDFFNEVTLSSRSTTTDRYDEILRIEDLENHLVESSNERLNIIDEDDGFIALPSGVKSAILASLAIVGLSLIVFLTILVIFKWSQKRKRHLNYAGSLAGSKIKSPILIEPPLDRKRSFRSFMADTLGRKKMLYKSHHLQSMSDSIWDNGNKSYMI